MPRTYAAEYSDYAVEGIKFFLSIQTLLAELRNDSPFIPWLKMVLAIQHPREQSARFAFDKDYKPMYLTPIGETIGTLLIEAVPVRYMNVDRLKHEITNEILSGVYNHVVSMLPTIGTEPGIAFPERQVEELNKRWVKRAIALFHEAIVKAGTE